MFFDCDGVLLDSNRVKTEALRRVAARWDAAAAGLLVAYHVENGGVSRFVKFRYLFESLLGLPRDDVEAAVETAAALFSAECRQGLLECRLLPGVESFLRELREMGIASWVVSGAEQNDLEWILREKGLAHFFERICGSPRNKREWLKELVPLAADGLPLFFGDAATDWKAAREYGLGFVFVTSCSEWLNPPIAEMDLSVADFTAEVGGRSLLQWCQEWCEQ